MKTIKCLILGLVFTLPSCGLSKIFTAHDPTPSLTVLFENNENFGDTLDSFREVIRQSTGIDEVTKTKILNKIDNVDSERKENFKALDDYLRSLGDINYEAIANMALEKYLEAKTGAK